MNIDEIERQLQTRINPLTGEPVATEWVVAVRIVKSDGSYHRTSFSASSASKTMEYVESHLERLGSGRVSVEDRAKIKDLVQNLFTPEIEGQTDEDRPTVLPLTVWQRLLALLRR